MHFVREHHKKVERVAIVTDSQFAGIAESLGKHFTSAEIRHFPFADDVKALDWLKTRKANAARERAIRGRVRLFCRPVGAGFLQATNAAQTNPKPPPYCCAVFPKIGYGAFFPGPS